MRLPKILVSQSVIVFSDLYIMESDMYIFYAATCNIY